MGKVVKTAIAPQVYTPLTQAQINKLANKQTAAAEAAAQAPITTAQTTTDAQAAAARAALASMGTAAGKLLSGIGPADQSAYQDAAQEEGALASGFSGSLADTMKAGQDAGQQFQQQQAPGSSSQEQVNPQDLGNTLYDLAGYIPGSDLASQGAAAAAYGNALPAVQESQTNQDVMANEGTQQQADAAYAKQLLDLAQQEPQLRDQILQTLYSNEIDKGKLAVQQEAENAIIGRDNALTAQGNARVNQGKIRLQLEAEGLTLRSQSNNLAVKKFLQQGGQIDASASKVAGYLVSKSGQPILKNGKTIPVAKTAKTTSVTSTGPGSTSYKEAYKYAITNWTVNGEAEPTEPFVSMQKYLVHAYGLPRQRARKLLVGMGFKPDGKRPNKK